MIDPRVISVDIESYGACAHDWDGAPLPEQTVFHPRRSIAIDGVRLDQLILSVAITLPEFDPRCTSIPLSNTASHGSNASDAGTTSSGTEQSSGPASLTSAGSSVRTAWTAGLLSLLRPAKTMVFLMNRPLHRQQLRRWLLHADTLMGINLPFDILYMRSQPDLRDTLCGRHEILDLSYLAFLEDDTRPERSLKALGPVLGLYRYTSSLREGRFNSPHDAKFHRYNGEDTHNAMLAVAELASRSTASNVEPHQIRG